MELKKTTVLSSFVCLAGILAQIMFHDILSKDVYGVIISIVLSVIIMISFYFVFDGIECLLQQVKDRDAEHQKEYEKRLYNILSEQIKFQKATYSEVKDIQQTQEAQQTEDSKPVIPEPTVVQAEPVVVEFPENLVYEESIEKLKQELNDHTTMSAKIVAKYVGRTSEEIREALGEQDAQVKLLLIQIEENQKQILELLKKK